MFCTNCGKSIPDESMFCPECGATLKAAAAPAAKPVAPAKKPVAPIAGKPLPLKMIALILTVACAVSMILSYVYVTGTSMENIPAMAVIMGDDIDEVKEMKYEIGEEVEAFEEAYEEIEDDLTSKEKKVVEKAIDVMKGLSKSFSINGIKDLAKVAQEIEDIEFENGYSTDGLADGADEITSVMGVITTITMIFMLLSLALCVLGGLLCKNGLVITGIVFSTLYGLIFCGFLFVILFAAINVATIMVNKKLKAEAEAV